MGAGPSLWQLLYSVTGLWGLALLLPLYLLALIRGDPAGRGLVHALAVGAAIGTLLALGSAAVPRHLPVYNEQFGLDVLILTMVTALALRSPRFYPLVLTALQLLIAITDAVVVAGLISSQATHAAIILPLAIVQPGVLVCGLIVHRRRPAPRARGDFRDSHLAPRANHAR